MEANNTGGGPSKLRPLPPLYEKINQLIGRAAEGYHNPYDADAGMIQPTSETCEETRQPVEEQQQQLEEVEEEGDDAAAEFTIQPELEFPERSETEGK
ncbi:Protein of unknown function [Gryllus bimaculatus]|nr:Protein of unknown function [Gryllus bimaculatus]